MVKRCSWATNEELIKYHDEEWGVPNHDDIMIFEMLSLDVMQAGLSWDIILNRRNSLREAFDKFDFNEISKYTEEDINKLMNNSEIIRNKKKIQAIINNAKRVIGIQNEFGSFDKYLWKFVENKPIKNKYKKFYKAPANTSISTKLSKDLKTRGFTFVGPTICYAFMQSIGMVNDHEIDCFRYDSCSNSKS